MRVVRSDHSVSGVCFRKHRYSHMESSLPFGVRHSAFGRSSGTKQKSPGCPGLQVSCLYQVSLIGCCGCEPGPVARGPLGSWYNNRRRSRLRTSQPLYYVGPGAGCQIPVRPTGSGRFFVGSVPGQPSLAGPASFLPGRVSSPRATLCRSIRSGCRLKRPIGHASRAEPVKSWRWPTSQTAGWQRPLDHVGMTA